jgi:hypothetical protein
MTEVNFTAESTSTIEQYLRNKWVLREKLRVESFPLRRFPSSKTAKSYVEGGEKIYNRVIEEFVTNGLPTELPVTDDLIKINDATAWHREGIMCGRSGEFFVFGVKKENGRVPTYVRKMRELNQQIEADAQTIKKAREELVEATKEYRQKLQSLLGPAAAHTVEYSRVLFINMNCPVSPYGFALVADYGNLPICSNSRFKYDHQKLWDGVYKT